tara:strand:- start:31 stop:360 length:330 start_codon:yes stop_codon:yes gene_type:complete
MARYIQDPVTHKLVPADNYYRPKTFNHSIHGDIEAFVSPIDQSVISDRNQLREHNKKHNVVSSSEFDQNFLNKQRKERERILRGEHTSQEKLVRKQEIYETIIKAERAN